MTHHNNLTILLVDDDPIFLSMGSNLISETTGMQVLLAADSMEAEKIMQSQSIDVLITDTNMPGKNGIELILWVRRNYSNTLIFSLFNGLIDSPIKKEDVLALGANYVLTKTEIMSVLIPGLQKRIDEANEYKKSCV